MCPFASTGPFAGWKPAPADRDLALAKTVSAYSAVVRKNWKFFLTSYNAMCYMYFHGISYKSAGYRAGKRYPAVLLDLPRTPGAGPGITERRRDRLGGRGSQHAHSDACPADAEQTTEPSECKVSSLACLSWHWEQRVPGPRAARSRP